MNEFESLGQNLKPFLAIIIPIAIVLILIGIAFLVFAIVGRWKLFEKAGEEGYKSIIPFYSGWTLIKIAGLKSYWFILYIMPSFASIIVDNDSLDYITMLVAKLATIAVCYNLSKKFNKSNNWFILSVFFANILIPILGYSKTDTYDKDVKTNENAFFGN